jgi:tRNA(fMet)-specific endonuclease VapC
MKYLLDTDICIYLIKNRPEKLRPAFNRHKPGDIGISAVTLYELAYGVYRSQFPARNRAALDQFIQPLTVIEFDARDADICGRLRAGLAARGQPIGAYDLQIAAQALARKLRLVTNNRREFARVPGLRIESWL